MNAEHAGLKAPRFSKPNEKARRALFDSVMEDLVSNKGARASDANMTKYLTNVKKSKYAEGSGSLNDLHNDKPVGRASFLRERSLPEFELPTKH